MPPLGREPALHCAIQSLITGPQLSPEVGFTAGVGSWGEGGWGVELRPTQKRKIRIEVIVFH